MAAQSLLQLVKAPLHPSPLDKSALVIIDAQLEYQNGKLPPREREMIILRTAWLVRSPFEWGEHVAYGRKLGLSVEEIERITQGSSAKGWSEHDRAVLRGVEELTCDYAVSDATWATLARTWTEPQLMELPGVVGSYTLTAMIYNTLRFGMLKGNEGFRTR